MDNTLQPFFSPALLKRLRDETPGCAHCTHLNNAGTALPPEIVLRATQDYLDLEARMGGYEAMDAAAEETQGFYTAVARMLNTQAHNIAYTTSATDSFVRALSAVPLRPGDIILTTEHDYASNQITFLALQKRLQIKLLRAADCPEGGVDVADLERLARQHRPALVAVAHIPTNSGLVQPVEAVGRICRELGLWYFVDACQSAGQMPLDVQQIGCDFLAATMRKFLRGPRGAGFLYVSDRVLDANLEMLMPDMYGATWTGADTYAPADGARRFEYYEMPPALVLGSKAAVQYALDLGLDHIEQRATHLAAYTRRLLAELPGVRVLDAGTRRGAIVTAYSSAWNQQTILPALRAHGINARLSTLPAGVIDFDRKGVPWALRVSPHYFNTEEEIEKVAEVLRGLGS